MLPEEDHPLSSADISIFYWKSAKFAILNTDIYRLYFDALFLTHLTFFLSRERFFYKHGYNFDDISKNGYSRHSFKKGFLK